MSRRYAYLMLGRYGVELLVEDSSSTVAVKLYVANASVLLPQVCVVEMEVVPLTASVCRLCEW
jgi:hypothetical protein